MKKIILLDRDGILNKKKKKGTYVTKWKEFRFIKRNIEGLTSLENLGYKFIIITNQAGVAKKKITLKKLHFIHKKMTQYLGKLGIKVLKIYICPHDSINNCNCRKPKPGLFYRAVSKYNFNLKKTLYIGDDPRDCLAAKNSGCKSILINKKKFFSSLNKTNKPLIIKNNIYDCINLINKFYTK